MPPRQILPWAGMRVSAAEHTCAMSLHTARRTGSSASSSKVIPA